MDDDFADFYFDNSFRVFRACPRPLELDLAYHEGHEGGTKITKFFTIKNLRALVCTLCTSC